MDRRDERRRRVRELRDGGASLRQIGEEMGISAATALRDVRAAGSAGSSSQAPEHGETASDGAGIGETTGAVDMSSYASVVAEVDAVYARLARGEHVPATQVRLLQARHAQLAKEEATCAEHMSMETYVRECHWRDQQWVDQLQGALRRLTASGAEQAEQILNEMLDRITEITAAGRPQNR